MRTFFRETAGALPKTAAFNKRLWGLWLLQVVAAAILLQTLYFKFTYAPETEFIFRDLGGRVAATAAGLVELLAVVLLLWPRFSAVGALVAIATMMGAMATHLFLVGIVIVNPETGQGDGGLLFLLACVVAASSGYVAWARRREIPGLKHIFHDP